MKIRNPSEEGLWIVTKKDVVSFCSSGIGYKPPTQDISNPRLPLCRVYIQSKI
jgi:hypothetical protein